MNKITIGILFISAGILYSALAWDAFYKVTLGWLVEHDFVKIPALPPGTTPDIGKKAAILVYGTILIAIGIYIIFISAL